MEEFTLDFFGEKAGIKKPTDLSFLREQIIKKFSFKEEDIEDIIIYYLKEDKKEYIKNDEDISNFLKENIFLIYLDVDKNSKLYLDCKSKIENENIDAEENTDLEKLIARKKELEKSEEDYLKSYQEKLTTLNRQLDILQAKKLDLVMTKKRRIEEYESKKEKIDKQMNELLEKENKEILKGKNKKEKTNHLISFNTFKEILDNIVEKVKDVTNEYIFKKSETTDETEKIEDIKKISKNAVDEINNLSRLVIKDIKEEKKIVLRGGAKNIANEENSDLCEKCENKNKHKLDHLSIKISNEDGGAIYTGVKCKGCGAIIWNEN